MAMKPGRFWFSLPSPYVTHEPMLGRGSRASPQLSSISDGSWLGTSACIERMMHMSSTHAARLGNRSLTSTPLLPCFANLKGEANAAPVFRSVRRLSGIGLPWNFARAGLGSKVSTCDGPPLRKMWMTRFALPGKCGFFGARGDTARLRSRGAPRDRPSLASNPASPSEAMPMPERDSSSRRVSIECISTRASVHERELVGQQQHLGVLL